MSTWIWDFGFDWDSAVHPKGDPLNRRYLLNGFIDVDGKHATQKGELLPPGSPFDIAPNDNVKFFFYDVTAHSSQPFYKNLVAKFEFEDPQGEAVNFLQGMPASFSLALAKPTNPTKLTQKSSIFSVYKATGLSHPEFNYFHPGAPGSPTVFVVEPVKIRCLMTVELSVSLSIGDPEAEVVTKTFWVDPEMVVGGIPFV